MVEVIIKPTRVRGLYACPNGDIWSSKRAPWRLLSQKHTRSGGYKFIRVHVEKSGRPGIQRKIQVSRLVCETFHGSPIGKKNLALHKNGNPSDNRSVNLYLWWI